MTYETVAHFSQVAALLLFFVMFLGVIAFAYWPGNKKRFEEAARMPLDSSDNAKNAGRS